MKQPVTLAGSWVFFDWQTADLIVHIPTEDSREFSLHVSFESEPES